MRWTLISFLCIITISNAMGQKHAFTDKIEGQSPINIGLNEVKKRFTPPSKEFQRLKSGGTNKSNINITYVGFPENAKIAFEYAISIWEQNLSSSIPICVLAKWENLQSNILAESQPSYFYKNFDATPVPDVYYPIALVEKLSGKEWNNSKEADIICRFSNSAAWYFGTDGNTPETSYDFTTVVLHEMAHGLGISGFLTDENEVGAISNSTKTPSAYDYYIYNSNKQRISDNSIFTSPSKELHSQLTSDNLDFGCNNPNCNDSKPAIYAPDSWKNGVSIYHLKNAQSNSNEDHELMSAFIYKGEANHNPGVNTLQILSKMGWDSDPFQIQEIKDIEETAMVLSIQTKVINGLLLDNSSIEIVFSTNNFASKDSALFSFNSTNQMYEAKLPIKNYLGKVLYYFKAQTTANITVKQPKQAPNNILTFKVGPDYYSPQLNHNPSKLVTSSNPAIKFSAVATDNIGIKSVKIEYKINGIAQETFLLNHDDADNYSGKLQIPGLLNKHDKIEYKIVAEDNSARKNLKFLPAQGLYQIEVFETLEPVSKYHSDFNSTTNDFTTTDFEINTPSGFNNGNLHTNQPYTTSELENEKYNLIAQLNQPIILEENGKMTFDEIVLVEPGEEGTVFTDDLFWDYVIVEASKNNGENWHAVVDGYDSGILESWESRFTDALKSNASIASATENLFWEQSINLTENAFFSAGDTVIFRFRLSSDKTVNGWGWAIDNLQIQNSNTEPEELLAQPEVNIYPNPCTNNLFIDCRDMTSSSSVEINITDLYGKTIYRETRYDIQYESNLQIDLSNINTGIYLASITDSELNTYTHKIIKN